MKKLLYQKKGQSLVEVVIAMAVIAVVVVAVMMPVLASRGLLYNSEDVTKATSLAEQGLEIIKNNRDIGCQFDAINPGNSGGTYDIVIFSSLLSLLEKTI